MTLDDVARAAEVSPITVSRALRDAAGVSPAVAERVKEVAKQMGYVPDMAARTLASKTGTQVLVLVPLLSNTLFVDVIEAVHTVLFGAGYQPVIGVTHYDALEEEQLLRSYLANRPAGLLITGFDRTEAARHLIAASGVPCVHLMESSSAPDVYSVGFSQEQAGAAITQHLIERGRKRIGFAGCQLDSRMMRRAMGYRNALRSAGLYDPKLELLSVERSSIALGARLFGDLLTMRPDLDAIFFCNDDLAQGGLLAAHRLGMRIPERLAVVGFNDLAGSEYAVPPLTTVHTPRTEVGIEGARMLLQLMEGVRPIPPCIDLPFELVVRESS